MKSDVMKSDVMKSDVNQKHEDSMRHVWADLSPGMHLVGREMMQRQLSEGRSQGSRDPPAICLRRKRRCLRRRPESPPPASLFSESLPNGPNVASMSVERPKTKRACGRPSCLCTFITRSVVCTPITIPIGGIVAFHDDDHEIQPRIISCSEEGIADAPRGHSLKDLYVFVGDATMQRADTVLFASALTAPVSLSESRIIDGPVPKRQTVIHPSRRWSSSDPPPWDSYDAITHMLHSPGDAPELVRIGELYPPTPHRLDLVVRHARTGDEITISKVPRGFAVDIPRYRDAVLAIPLADYTRRKAHDRVPPGTRPPLQWT